jgi:carbon storage regulator
MLVLSRRSNESVQIQDYITITILEIRGQSVKLGFTAPDNVPIHRSEIYQKIQAEKKAIPKV